MTLFKIVLLVLAALLLAAIALGLPGTPLIGELAMGLAVRCRVQAACSACAIGGHAWNT